MSWTDRSAEIETLLSGLGYDPVADDEGTEDEPFMQHKDKTFNLKSNGLEGQGQTSNGVCATHKVELDLFYVDSDSSHRNANVDLFNLATMSICKLADFHGEIKSEFTDLDELHQKGIFQFYYGIEVL